MRLQIITPQKTIFDGNIVSLTAPGKDGFFQILENHTAVVSTLEKGMIIFRESSKDNVDSIYDSSIKENKNGEYEVNVNSGMLELNNNHIILLAE